MKTTVITTTCGIIYSRQFEWLMWQSGWAASKMERYVGQFLCDFKQCLQCLWQVGDMTGWCHSPHPPLTSILHCVLPLHPPPPETPNFPAAAKEEKLGTLFISAAWGCERWQLSCWRHWWLLRWPGDREPRFGDLQESPGLPAGLCPL